MNDHHYGSHVIHIQYTSVLGSGFGEDFSGLILYNFRINWQICSLAVKCIRHVIRLTSFVNLLDIRSRWVELSQYDTLYLHYIHCIRIRQLNVVFQWDLISIFIRILDCRQHCKTHYGLELYGSRQLKGFWLLK